MVGVDVLLGGFFGRTDRGLLGWSGVYLVSSPGGRRILFDTGGYNERGTLPRLLEERGLAPADISCVVLSHLHFDHAANWDLCPKAEIVVHEKELAYARTTDDPAVLRSSVPDLLAHPKLRRVAGEATSLEEGVEIQHVPGHTPGAIALVMGDSALCGDALKSRWDLRGVLTNTWDPDLARRSIRRITGLARHLYPGHDVPLELRGNDWHPCGTPSVRIQFPDGSERVLRPPPE